MQAHKMYWAIFDINGMTHPFKKNVFPLYGDDVLYCYYVIALMNAQHII